MEFELMQIMVLELEMIMIYNLQKIVTFLTQALLHMEKTFMTQDQVTFTLLFLELMME